jgi:hypothetical protein
VRSALLVHGLAGPIRRARVTPFGFAYSASLESMPRIVERLRKTILERQPEFLVSHSLGCILLRLALADLDARNIRHFFMLGPPNQSPRLARFFVNWGLPFRLFAGSCGRFLSMPGEYQKLPIPPCPVTVFAGTAGPTGWYSPFGNEPNDGVVSLNETRIAEGCEPVQVDAWHTWILSHPTVLHHLQRSMTLTTETVARMDR